MRTLVKILCVVVAVANVHPAFAEDSQLKDQSSLLEKQKQAPQPQRAEKNPAVKFLVAPKLPYGPTLETPQPPRPIGPISDFGRYMQWLQDSILSRWKAPVGYQSLKPIRVGFKIDPDGTLENLHLLHSCGVTEFDDTALKVVRETKFKKLPQVANEPVDIEFTFDGKPKLPDPVPHAPHNTHPQIYY